MKDLKDVSSPVAFGSGDVHFSEIMKVEKDLLGYKTYEFTSSPVHSYMFGDKANLWKNDRRIAGSAQHNYMIINSKAASPTELKVSAASYDALGNLIPEVQVNDLSIKR